MLQNNRKQKSKAKNNNKTKHAKDKIDNGLEI